MSSTVAETLKSTLQSGIKGRNFLLIPSITFLHKPNPWCLRMANPEPLPQRATRISRRLRGQEPVLESCPARVVGSTATPPSGGLSPNGDNSNPPKTRDFCLTMLEKDTQRDLTNVVSVKRGSFCLQRKTLEALQSFTWEKLNSELKV